MTRLSGAAIVAASFLSGAVMARLLVPASLAATELSAGNHRMETLLAAGYEIKAATFLPYGNLGMLLQKGTSVYQCGKDDNGKIAPCFPLVSSP
jgi:hypothetical protein